MNANDILKYGHLTLMGTLDGLRDSDWTEDGACGWWTIKDLVAHLASYELVLVGLLSVFTGDKGSFPTMDDYFADHMKFNDDQVLRRRSKSIVEQLAEYKDAQAQVTALVSRLSPETLREVGTLPWYGAEYALDDYLVYAFYGHKREHSGQIAVFKDHLPKG